VRFFLSPLRFVKKMHLCKRFVKRSLTYWITVTMIFGIILDCFGRKERKFVNFAQFVNDLFVYIRKMLYLCSDKGNKQLIFETMFGVKSSNQPISGQFAEDFVKNLLETRKQPRKDAKKLDRQYSMTDIREYNRLIDPDWRMQPMRPWSEVYDELCCEVGQVYGLNDIREA